MRGQNGNDNGHGLLHARWIRRQKGRGRIPQHQETTGPAGDGHDDPGDEIGGDDAEQRRGQKGDHAVAVQANPFGPRERIHGHAAGGKPKGARDAKDEGEEEAKGVEQMVNVVLEFLHVRAVVEGGGKVGSCLLCVLLKQKIIKRNE